MSTQTHTDEKTAFHAAHSHCDELLDSLAGATLDDHAFTFNSDGDIVTATLKFIGGRTVVIEPWGRPMSFEEKK